MHRTLLREELDEEEAKSLGVLKKKEEIDRKKKKSKKATADKRDVIKGQKVNPSREGMSGSAVNPSAEQIAAQSNLSDSAPDPVPHQQIQWTQSPQAITLAQQAQLHYQQQQQIAQPQWQIPPPPSHPHSRTVQIPAQYQPQATPPHLQMHYQSHPGQFVRAQFVTPFVLPQGTPQIVSHGISQGIPPGVTQGVPQGVSPSIPQGVSQGVPQGGPQVVPQGMSQGVPQGVSQGVPQGGPQGVPQGSFQGMVQEVPQGAVIQMNNQPGIPQSAPQIVSHGVPHVLPQGANPNVSQVTQEIVQQDVQEGTTSAHQRVVRSNSDPTVTESRDDHVPDWPAGTKPQSHGESSQALQSVDGDTSWANVPADTHDSSWVSSTGDDDKWKTNNDIHGEQWATFPIPTDDRNESDDEREYAEHSSDEIESSDEETPSGSPVLFGEEGDVLLRAPSLTSFAESTSSVEEEGEENPWVIQPEQKDYYTKQFLKLQPIEDGLVKGPKARDFFMKSNLPTEVLSRIWQLSDVNKDNALNLDEFCIAMHLVVALRHGLDLPTVLPDVLLPHRGSHNGPAQGIVRQSSVEFNSSQEHTLTEDSSPVQPIPARPTEAMDDRHRQDEFADSRPRSFSDPSSFDEYHESIPRKTSLQAGYHVQGVVTNQKGPAIPVLPPPTVGGTQAHSQVVQPILPPPPTAGGLLQNLPQGSNQAGLGQGLYPGPPQLGQGAQIMQNSSQVAQSSFQAQQPEQTSTLISNEKTVSHAISRPRAAVKPSLLDAGPEQLLPPPSGKFSREGWTPTKITHPSHTVSSPPPPLNPVATGPSLSPPPGSSSPTPPISKSPVPQGTHDQKETPPSSPVMKTPTQTPTHSPPHSPSAEVGRRPSKRSGERPRSMGDVKISSPSDSSVNSSQELEKPKEKKEMPPPPPPRNKRGHSRSSSLDLNKLFAAKAKEKLAATSSASSSHSSHSSQASSASAPAGSSQQDLPQESEACPTADKIQEASEANAVPAANFADFSKFDSFMQSEQPSTDESHSAAGASSTNRSHRRSMSVDHVTTREWPGDAIHLPTHPQEALPRPVAKVQPPNPLPLTVTRRPDRSDKESGSETEKKLKTNPPKVVVRPLTKEDVLHTRIRDLKDKNVSLSRVNSEMQQELKEVMEMRVVLELQLERLSPFTTTQ